MQFAFMSVLYFQAFATISVALSMDIRNEVAMAPVRLAFYRTLLMQ